MGNYRYRYIYGTENRKEKVVVDDDYNIFSVFCYDGDDYYFTGKKLEVKEVGKADEIEKKLETALNSLDFVKEIDSGDMTIIVPYGQKTIYSYEIIFRNGIAYFSDNDVPLYGDGAEVEDFIIEFKSFEDFENFIETPTIDNLEYMLQFNKIVVDISKYVAAGGSIQRKTEFIGKYQDALESALPSWKIELYGLADANKNELIEDDEFNDDLITHIADDVRISDEKGHVDFSETLDLSDIDEFKGGIEIGKSYIIINSDKYPQLNKQATITLFGTNIADPMILRNGEVCEECTIVSNSPEQAIVFTVPGFSRYDVVPKVYEDEFEEEPQEEEKNVQMNHIGLNSDTIMPGEILRVTVSLKDDLESENAKVTLSIPELAIHTSKQVEIDEEERATLMLDIPFNAQPGFYTARISYYDNGYRRVKHREIEII